MSFRPAFAAPLKVFLGIVCALGVATSARAAEPTNVADAFDSYNRGGVYISNDWDFNFRVWFNHETAQGTITRDPVARPASGVSTGCTSASARSCAPLDEIAWNMHTYWLKLEAEFGLYRDFSLTVGTAYAISRKFQYQFADGVGPDTSSVDFGGGEYFDLQGNGTTSKQTGWRGLDFTLRYAILNEDRDDTQPSWVVGLGLSTPWLSKTYNPGSDAATDANPAGVGDGVYRLMLSTAFSKRLLHFNGIGFSPENDRYGYIDPYFTMSYMLPIPGPSALPDLKNASDDNPFGHAPSHIFETRAGLEVVPWTDTRALRRVAILLGGVGRFYTAGRNYSILTPALRETTYTQEYFDVGGQTAILVQIAAFVHVSFGVSFMYTTAHYLTTEPYGRDTNGDGAIISGTGDQLNPYYCGNTSGDRCSRSSSNANPYDQAGTRFRDPGHLTTDWYGSVALTF